MNDTDMPCRRMVITLASVAAAALCSGGCGASIQAVYEGNVRFEHCMALDAQTDVKPAIRRACWTEWVQFYTYGQTRDRVVHAQIRIRQLSVVSEFVDPSMSRGGEGRGPVATVPPGLGVQGVASHGPQGDTEESGDHCAGLCRSEAEDCSRSCTSPGCRKGCSIGFSSCVRRCG
jgi:hypothetical protein